ncbi:MAG: sulfite exporter TauE/SafE family protein [Terrimicrobiaceae bacterium]|nr:sulfite exporter TauE/SafE family protein [Terrimicrobiaceae bacterium]
MRMIPAPMHLAAFTSAQWLLCAAAALCIGMAKTGFGGISAVALVLMALVMPARESTGVLLTILIVGDIYAVCAFHRHANWRVVLRLLPAAFLGIFAGWILMPLVPDGAFRPLLGGVTLALIGLLFIQRALPRLATAVSARPAFGWIAGWTGGVTTMIANAAGPIMAIYLLACRLPKMEFVGTGAWFFFVVNLIKVPFSASLGLITRDSLLLTLALAPLVAAGAFLGKWLLLRINQSLFETLLLAFTLLAAVRLLLG